MFLRALMSPPALGSFPTCDEILDGLQIDAQMRIMTCRNLPAIQICYDSHGIRENLVEQAVVVWESVRT